MAKKKVKIPSKRGGKGGKRNNQKDLMRQLNQMQEQFLEAQNKLEEEEFTATSGGGAVEATVNGALILQSIKIDPEVIDEDDVELLEDLIVAAVSSAQSEAGKASSSQTDLLSSQLPAGFNLPEF